MSALDDSLPAFPGFNYVTSNVHDGMTLRDYFAAKALQGMLADSEVHPEINESYDVFATETAESCYALSDAMLEARKK